MTDVQWLGAFIAGVGFAALGFAIGIQAEYKHWTRRYLPLSAQSGKPIAVDLGGGLVASYKITMEVNAP